MLGMAKLSRLPLLPSYSLLLWKGEMSPIWSQTGEWWHSNLVADIGNRESNEIPSAKDRNHFGPTPPGAVKSIITADDIEHMRC